MQELEFTRTRRQQLSNALPMIYFVVMAWHYARSPGLVGVAIAGSITLVLNRGNGTAVTSAGIQIRIRGRSRRDIPWQTIRSMEAYGGLMGSKVVRLHPSDGKRRRLPAPFTVFGAHDPDFAAKFATIQRW